MTALWTIVILVPSLLSFSARFSAGIPCRSFYEQSESAAPHFPSFGIAMVDWQIRKTHFEYDIVKKNLPPIPDGSGKFLVSYLVQLPHSFLYPFFSRDKL